jgi:hypothetical protein
MMRFSKDSSAGPLAMTGALEENSSRRRTVVSDAVKRALVEEFERALLEFAEFIRGLPDDLLDVPVPGEEGSVRRILGHVVSCGYGHVSSVADHAGGIRPERRFTDPDHLADMRTYVAALLDVVRHAREALAPVQDAAMEPRFTARWGQIYDGEQMMEHAICHPGRHMRQLKKFLDGEL